MSWWGKLIGGAFGFALGGPLGAALGAALGHNFDEENTLQQQRTRPRAGADKARQQHELTQTAFFTATFTLMGHLAKADGLVSKAEIHVAETVMQQMRLSAQQRKLAMALFEEGKKPGFVVAEALTQLRQEAHRSSHLLQMFVEIQIAVALADGELHTTERHLLSQFASALGFNHGVFLQLLQRMQASQQRQSGATQQASKASQLASAYKVLGVSKDASAEELKKAYRRLMNQHHPDKLVAKGLPQEMMELAAKKTMEIKDAYELIKKHQG